MVPPLGVVVRGRVVSHMKAAGAFVRLPGAGNPLDGFCPLRDAAAELAGAARPESADDAAAALAYYAPVGQDVFARVEDVRQDPTHRFGVRVRLSMAAVDQDTGEALPGAAAPRQQGGGPESDGAPEVGSILRASVASVQAYGVFVRLPGFRKNGLVHSSQVSDHLSFTRDDSDDVKVRELSEVVSVGDEVFVKVVEAAETDRGLKIGCSIKVVNQTDGRDLDPGMRIARPRAERRGEDDFVAPINAGVGRVGASGVIDWGHELASVKQLGGKQYELLADVDDVTEPPPFPSFSQALPPPPPPPVTIRSEEEARAVLDRHKEERRREKREKKAKHGKKAKREKTDKHKKHSSKKRKREARSPSSSSSS